MMGYFSRPGDFKKWFIAYHKEQTNEERWRGLQITYTQAPEDTGRWKRGGALMAFQQSAKHSLEYRQCHLPEVRYVTDVYLRSPGGWLPVTVFNSENSPSETRRRVLPGQTSQEPWGSRNSNF